MKFKGPLPLLVGLASLVLLAAAFHADSQAQVIPELTIFYTNDAWGYLEPCG